MNLVRLFTHKGVIYVDSDELARGRTILRIYTARGNKLSETARTERERETAGFGVHRENLYASPKLAKADYERIIADMTRRAAT
jgi:hypothetical protein